MHADDAVREVHDFRQLGGDQDRRDERRELECTNCEDKTKIILYLTYSLLMLVE